MVLQKRMTKTNIHRQKGCQYYLKKCLRSVCCKCKSDLDEINDFEQWGIAANYQQIGDIELLDNLRANFEVKMMKTKRAYEHWA